MQEIIDYCHKGTIKKNTVKKIRQAYYSNILTMKTICIFSLLLLSIFAKAQDTLVSSNGAIIPAYIVETDSMFISYKGIDTTKNEVNLIERAHLLLIKHREGKVEQFYMNDTLITMTGETVLTKVIEIAPELITCFYYGGIISEPNVIPSSSVFMIKMHDGTKEIIDHAKKETAENAQLNYFEMGERDAEKYFRTSDGAIVGEVVSGITTWILLGTIPGAAIGFTKPSNLHNSTNPNDKLLDTNPLYRSGYANKAKNKKQKACAIAYGTGVAIPVVLLVGAIMVALN
jgi:hypothetical protein